MKFNLEIVEVKTENEICETAKLAAEIWNECYAELLEKTQINYMVSKFQTAGAIAGQIEKEGYHYFLVLADGEAAGYLGLQPKDGKVLISKFYLCKAFRGQGHARELFAFIGEKAKSWGCSAYWLTVNKGNERAIAAYERNGMSLLREQVADIGGGFVMDDYVFEKALPT